MSTIRKRKESKREKLSTHRENLSRETIEDRSLQIWGRVKDLPEFKKAEKIAFYVAKKGNSEVETEQMIEESLDMGKRIAVPIVDEDKLKLSYIKNPDEDLERGAYGILEPKEESRNIVPVEEMELIIVPGLAFDENGNRLGYGGGYYDGLLKETPRETDFVGLAYEFQIGETVPHDESDVPIHYVVTEKRTIDAYDKPK